MKIKITANKLLHLNFKFGMAFSLIPEAFIFVISNLRTIKEKMSMIYSTNQEVFGKNINFFSSNIPEIFIQVLNRCRSKFRNGTDLFIVTIDHLIIPHISNYKIQ